MQTIKFKYMSAKNFFAFGPEGIEIFFDDLGNIVLVQGINLDTGTMETKHSNGAGKSSIVDIMSYGFYGKPVKKPKQLGHKEMMNHQASKNLEVEIQFNEYRIVRSREPNKLKLWKSKDGIWDASTEVKGTEVQEEINGIVGLNHAAFCAVVVVDDSDRHTFLELALGDKRNIVENILGLDCYRDYHENAKDYLKELKAAVKAQTECYSKCSDAVDEAKKKIVQIEQQEKTWLSQKQTEIANLKTKITQKQAELDGLDAKNELKKYQDAQQKLETLKATLLDNENKKSKIEEALVGAKQKQNDATIAHNQALLDAQTLKTELERISTDKKSLEADIKQMTNLQEGVKCDYCFSTVAKKNYSHVLEQKQNKLSKINDDADKAKAKAVTLQQELAAKKTNLDTITKAINDATGKTKEIQVKNVTISNEIDILSKVKKPDLSAKQQVLESEITLFKTQLEEKEKEAAKSPYIEILKTNLDIKTAKETECEQAALILREKEKLLPYGEFFVDAFGDSGIRKYVISGIVPTLNNNIRFWFECLIDGMFELTLDDELKESIYINGRLTEYAGLSNGEKRRINIAVSLGWGYVGTLSAGKTPSVVFLDEITGGGIDVAGVNGIYKMIQELAKERQVFLTTHNQTLIDMLQGCKTLTLIKKGGISRLQKE